MAVPTTTTAIATPKLIPSDDIENITERPPDAGRILDGDMVADHPTPAPYAHLAGSALYVDFRVRRARVSL